MRFKATSDLWWKNAVLSDEVVDVRVAALDVAPAGS
jgi:hypothetical protein